MSALSTILGSLATAALAWAAYKIYTKDTKDKSDQEADQEEGAGDYELPTLRTRPLKPAVDLSLYDYM